MDQDWSVSAKPDSLSPSPAVLSPSLSLQEDTQHHGGYTKANAMQQNRNLQLLGLRLINAFTSGNTATNGQHCSMFLGHHGEPQRGKLSLIRRTSLLCASYTCWEYGPNFPVTNVVTSKYRALFWVTSVRGWPWEHRATHGSSMGPLSP